MPKAKWKKDSCRTAAEAWPERFPGHNDRDPMQPCDPYAIFSKADIAHVNNSRESSFELTGNKPKRKGG